MFQPIVPPVNFPRLFSRSVKRTSRMGSRVYGAIPASVGAGSTLSFLWTLESQADYVRGVYMNDSSSSYTLTSAAVSPTAELNDNVNPMNSSGVTDQTMWVNLTCNGAGADVAPWNTASGSTRSLTIPANTSGHTSNPDVQLAKAYTDWVPFSPLARIDIPSALPLVLTRSYFAAAARCTNPQSTASLNALTGRDYVSSHMSGDQATTPGTFSAAGHGFGAPFALEYYSRVPSITVLAVGDSLVESLNSTANSCGFGLRACAQISTPNLPVSYVNGGWRSMTMADYAVNGIDAIQWHRPQIVLILITSRNDPLTAAQQTLSWQLAQQLIECALDNGAVPILVTPSPWTTATTTALEAIRLQNIAKAYASGWPVLDQNALIGDGGNPARLKSIYDSGDGIHCNDAGEGVLAAALAPLLTSIIGFS